MGGYAGGSNPNDVWLWSADLSAITSSDVKAAVSVLTPQVVDSIGSFRAKKREFLAMDEKATEEERALVLHDALELEKQAQEKKRTLYRLRMQEREMLKALMPS